MGFSSKSNREIVIALSIFLGLGTILGGIMTYTIHQSISKANQRLEKIQLKFHKFLFYLKYIYKTEKNHDQKKQQQNNIMINLIKKLSTGFDKISDQSLANPIKAEKAYEEAKDKNALNKFVGNQTKQILLQAELLNEKEIIDVAIKIIQDQRHEKIDKQINNKQQDQIQKIQIQGQENLILQNPNIFSNKKQKIENFPCHIDKHNKFFSNFQFDGKTKKLKKSIYTSSFEPIICSQTIPKEGIWELSIKILKTLKSFIYVGIVGGSKDQVYNVTSLHQTSNFYGYSGYSGRIWDATQRKNAYEMFQTNTIFKLQVNINTSSLGYFYNQEKVGQSFFGNLCDLQCRFVIEMHNDGDQIQFLEPLQIDVPQMSQPLEGEF